MKIKVFLLAMVCAIGGCKNSDDSAASKLLEGGTDQTISLQSDPVEPSAATPIKTGEKIIRVHIVNQGRMCAGRIVKGIANGQDGIGGLTPYGHYDTVLPHNQPVHVAMKVNLYAQPYISSISLIAAVNNARISASCGVDVRAGNNFDVVVFEQPPYGYACTMKARP